ncbi:unnamed protein product [Parascedosporium putredinis]|uniref:Cytochrome b561 domain-containing protein n=1 Tax=Parascedosporium putredinis TaxID=1442378 RepID=A0A9P1GYJ9_9PEZI|nr:unnamed protein product [Parascedosporium putredinis]CAI7990067.1 unnamed protein product [Parascedosporium putredinis]
MWAGLSRIGSVAAGALLLAGGLLSNPVLADTDGQSTFVTEDKSMAFGFTVPDIKDDDFFFTIRFPKEYAWGAIGLGSEDMDGALVLMVYVRSPPFLLRHKRHLLPRYARGHYEPAYYPNFEYRTLPGTGVTDNHFVVSAHCLSGCRSWPGGYIDVSDDNQKAIFALGPKETFRSNDPAAPLRYHSRYGSFKIALGRTRGAGDAPEVSDGSSNQGTEPHMQRNGRWDPKSTMHAVFMILVFVVLLPLGVFILRIGNSPKWHAVNQFISLLGALVGFALGILTSFHYQRSRKFVSSHQVIGYLVIAGLIGQFVVGVMHHIRYRRREGTGKLTPVHVWVGRIVIFLGSINAFLGFQFALVSMYNLILAGIIILLTAVSCLFTFHQGLRSRILRRSSAGSGFAFPKSSASGAGASGGFNREPWRSSGLDDDAVPYRDSTVDSTAKRGGGGGGATDLSRQEYSPPRADWPHGRPCHAREEQ